MVRMVPGRAARSRNLPRVLSLFSRRLTPLARLRTATSPPARVYLPYAC